MWQRKIYLDNEPVEKAWEKCQGFFSSRGLIRPLDTERIPVAKALGRVTASPVLALISSPHYAAAAMDGIAVLAKNTFGATETAPLKLQLGNEAVEVDTGDPIPEGFDAVIMAEEINYSRDGMIEITAAAAPWQHVRAIGEDLVATEMIVPANHLLRPYDIGGILAGGVVEVEVWRRPRVAIIPTGTELVEPGTPLKPGDIMEFNSKMLGAFVEEWGGEPVICPIVPDDYETIKGAVREAAQKAEVIVINAGSSAGREDYTASIISELGELCLHGVAMKPGKPVMVGSACGKPVVGIPGYPVSAALTFETFVKPIIFSKLGQPLPEKPVLEGFLARKLPSPLGTEEFVRVTLGQVGGKVMVIPIARGAGVISSLIRADGILRIPASSKGLEAGGR
ncbi:MAG TPA: molybdopterin biosynthesis protein, partial [Clostridia bacterium]|nr:molybdopterin biosynthesis protein [Clostridia bacterium]